MDAAPLPASTNSATPPSSEASSPNTRPTSAGPERRVEAAERPRREQHRHGEHQRVARAHGHAELRHQRRERACTGCHRFGHQRDADGLRDEHHAQYAVDEHRRRRQEVHGEPRQDRTGGGAERRRGGVGDGAARLVDVQHPGAHGRDGSAGGKALQHARDQQTRETVRSGEQQHRRRLRQRCGDQHRAAPDVVGQPAGNQQRGEQGDRVHGEDARDHRRRKAPFGLVDGIERGRRTRSGQERGGDRCQQVEGGAGRKGRGGAGGVPVGRGVSGCGHGGFRVDLQQTGLSVTCIIQTCLVLSSHG